MVRTMFAAALFLAAGLSAHAQERGSGSTAAPASGTGGGAGNRGGNVTSTGQTVPLPGASKGAGTTSLDRGVQQKDSDIQGSVCKGC